MARYCDVYTGSLLTDRAAIIDALVFRAARLLCFRGQSHDVARLLRDALDVPGDERWVLSKLTSVLWRAETVPWRSLVAA